MKERTTPNGHTFRDSSRCIPQAPLGPYTPRLAPSSSPTLTCAPTWLSLPSLCLQWHTYVGAKLTHQNGAMRVMTSDGQLIKYDVTHNDTDTGVLMIRDFLFATVFGDQYVTCQGDFLNDCQGCFRSNSNFVKRIMDSRRRFGRPNHERWWRLAQSDLPTAKLAAIDPKAAVNNA